MAHRLRPATPDDRALLLAVYASTRADELALTGWPPAQCQAFVEMQFDAQWRHYHQQHPQSLCQLVVADEAGAGACLGRLWVDRSGERLHVLDIALLPAARGQGTGSALLRSLMAEARQRGVPLTISVEIHNPARRLYDRLGFQPQGAAQGIHQRMAWLPLALHATHHQECLP
ncbi:MAG: N-acetyltransferase [Pseudomonadota bacterium]